MEVTALDPKGEKLALVFIILVKTGRDSRREGRIERSYLYVTWSTEATYNTYLHVPVHIRGHMEHTNTRTQERLLVMWYLPSGIETHFMTVSSYLDFLELGLVLMKS